MPGDEARRRGEEGKPWFELTDKEKKVRIAILAVLGVAVVAGFVVLLVSM